MKLLSIAALLAVFSLPLAASAQQVQQPYPPQYPGQAYPMAPQMAPSNVSHVYTKWMRLLSGLNLSAPQMQQIQGAIGQYAQAHPAGSPRDPQGARALRQQIFSMLNPQQQAQLESEIQALRAQHQQRRMEQQQQQQGQAPYGPPMVGPPMAQPPYAPQPMRQPPL